MSEPRLVSPLLDNFAIGNPISDHHGVVSYPAMRNDSDERYILKVISIPATSVQLQALLISGAYPDQQSAMAYYHDLVRDVEDEAKLLSKLSKLEGFLPYEGIQTVEKEDGSGYEVYILITYKRSLQRHFRKEAMTHLAAVNLGLDMCASLAVARHSGYLYADLKPSNIFISDDNEYRIGDIGFLRMSGLQYAALPDRYRSAYTPPELGDPFAQITPTIDTYSAGMILYQAYNGGQLPEDMPPAGEPLPPPLYADYEMAQIILKAISPNPADRWQDPIQMGQEIVSYMQRNGANDTPITPPTITEEAAPEVAPAVVEQAEETPPEPIYEQSDESGQLMIETMLDYDSAMDASADLQSSADDQPGIDSGEANEEYAQCNQADTADEPSADADALCVEEVAVNDPLSSDATPAENPEEAAGTEADTDGELSFLNDLVNDETAPDEENTGEISYTDISDDLSSILAQADDLIAHETPPPVVAPEAIEISLPEPVIEEAADEPGEDDPIEQTVAAIDEAMATSTDGQLDKDLTPEIELPEEAEPEAEDDAPSDDTDENDENPKSKNIVTKVLTAALVLIIIACFVVLGLLFYNDYYLKTVDKLTINGHEDKMEVYVEANVDHSLLTVVCTDSYGNRHTARLENGVATFSELSPKTLYKITLDISGFHGLDGQTKGSYTTEACTEIIDFNALCGTEATSAILNFTVKGDDFDSWKVVIATAGEPERTETFTGHNYTVTGLTVGKTYQFSLDASESGYVVGESKLTYTATDLIIPQNIQITGCTEEGLSVSWEAPEGVTVSSWTAYCSGVIEGTYNHSLTTNETSAVFPDIDPAAAYNIEIVAEGMSKGDRVYLSANAVTASDIKTNITNGDLEITWNSNGTNTGWCVTYFIEDDPTEHLVDALDNRAVIENIIPGSSYRFYLGLLDGTSVINGQISIDIPQPAKFEGYGVTADNMTFRMCLVPEFANWNLYYVTSFRDSFASTEKAGFTMRLNQYYATSADIVDTLIVFRDANGSLVSSYVLHNSWTSMWYLYNGEIELPALPATPGEYSIYIYFNGGSVHTQTFTVTES